MQIGHQSALHARRANLGQVEDALLTKREKCEIPIKTTTTAALDLPYAGGRVGERLLVLVHCIEQLVGQVGVLLLGNLIAAGR